MSKQTRTIILLRKNLRCQLFKGEMETSSIIFDADLDYLEQHQIETLLQILKDKYGKGTRIKATGDSSFEYICSCPVHKDGQNPNGRVAFAEDGNLRLYCNGACSVEETNTWFFGPLLERLGVNSSKLATNVRDRDRTEEGNPSKTSAQGTEGISTRR